MSELATQDRAELCWFAHLRQPVLADYGMPVRIGFEAKETVDTSRDYGKLVLNMVSTFAEFERNLIRERQMEGIAKAKLEGEYRGREPTARAKTEAPYRFSSRAK